MTMNGTSGWLAILSIGLLGCGVDAPISEGTTWTLHTVESSTSTQYWLREGSDPVESVGPLGSSTSCILAETSAGTSTATSSTETFTINTALGDTELYHPLIPNSDKFSVELATVLQRRSRGAGSIESTVMTYDPNSVMGNTTTTTYADQEISTGASFHGIAMDEYVVEFDLGNLWSDPESELDASSMTLLTRAEPKTGDIWASQNGNTVFIAGAKELLQFGGAMQKTVKVEAYEVGNLQGDGADIIEQCFQMGVTQTENSDPSVGNTASNLLFLDPGCQGLFEHVKVGTEWWMGPILVKEKSEVTRIEITNYGYEWYDLDETGTICNRQTSLTQDSPNAILFAEYNLVTTSRESEISQWAE